MELTVDLNRLSTTTWPTVVPRCLRCGSGPPEHRYRGRGLCTTCHGVLAKHGGLRKYRAIPKDIQDRTLRLMHRNPRRYVQGAVGNTYAQEFADHEVHAEAVRVFTAFVLRWYKHSAPLFAMKVTAEEAVAAQGLCDEYTGADEERVDVPVVLLERPAEAPAPAEPELRLDDADDGTSAEDDDMPPLPRVMAVILAVQDAVPLINAVYGAYRVDERFDRWVITWGTRYRFMACTVPKKASRNCSLRYQDGLGGGTLPYSTAAVQKVVNLARLA